MTHDAFSRCHPAVNFLYFAGAIGCGVVIQHPAYILAAILGSGIYCFLLQGRKSLKLFLGILPLFLLTAAVNPLFNTEGNTVLFSLFSRPYTLEALLYGADIAGIFVVMILWFACYSQVLTSDKFTYLFGSLIPSLSLLLVMVLRMIPSFLRKARQISGVRSAIGKGIGESADRKEKLRSGITILSALTDWSLEGGIVTADSMRARGYGCQKRSSFHSYSFSVRDWILLLLMSVLALVTLLIGDKSPQFTPMLQIPGLSTGFAAYCVYLSIPAVIHLKEVIAWHISRSGI